MLVKWDRLYTILINIFTITCGDPVQLHYCTYIHSWWKERDKLVTFLLLITSWYMHSVTLPQFIQRACHLPLDLEFQAIFRWSCDQFKHDHDMYVFSDILFKIIICVHVIRLHYSIRLWSPAYDRPIKWDFHDDYIWMLG